VPTYQYTCTECGQRLEAVQSFSDPALTECPNCHGRLRKVFNSVGIVFKGSGFYRNDSRAGNGASADVKADSTKPESTKPESTPAPSVASSSSASSASPSSSTPTSAKAAPAPA
jgi:putative FmdB family regulatory protein